MGWIIRPMKKEDIKCVQKIAQVSWNAAYKDLIPRSIQERFLAEAYSLEMLQNRLQNTYLYIAVKDGKKVGFANFSPVTKSGLTELGAIYILPEEQGQGIGTALLNKGIQSLNNVEEVLLHVEKNNQTALNFYRKKGFVKIDIVRDFLYDYTLETYQMLLKVDEYLPSK